MKLTVHPRHRERLHAALIEVLGCRSELENEGFTPYLFDDGFRLGVYFSEESLDDDSQRLGAWLELLVDDASETGRKLEALGVGRVEYGDVDHRYYQLPGGPVFRVGKRS